jgi:hypothetical protein
MNTEPHLRTIGLVDRLRDEASFVEWEQDSSALSVWQTRWRRLVAGGRSATLTNASDANDTRAFPDPVEQWDRQNGSLTTGSNALTMPTHSPRRLIV